MAELFTEHTAPELLYLESRWASLISFGMTTALLKDVLPVANTTNPETIRCHLHKVAARQDGDLGASELGLRDDGPAAGQASPIAREAVIVGIDGGYLRNWHDKQKKFEVIVGKSMAEDRDDRYLVRSQDAAPKRRLREVLRQERGGPCGHKLAGGRMPSGLFGANAAWIMILGHNLNAVMKRLVLGPAWVARRMKALRFSLINLPGRIIRHGRRLIIRVVGAGETLALLLSARRTILALAPSG